MQTAPTAMTLALNSRKAWALSTLFVLGNIILPQICHLVPQGGLIFLPIYFFTLIAAYKYGWQVGLVTAVASPIINSALFGMPPTAMLPIIIIKGVLLASAAALVAQKYAKATIISMIAVVLSYQIVGCGIESLMASSISASFQDFTLGAPGMLIQIIAGWLILRR